MRASQKTFAEEFERVLVESDTSVRRLARLSGVSRRTLENWLYRHTIRPRYPDPILQVARALQLPAVDIDRLLLSAGHPSLTRLRQNKQLQPDVLLEWQLPPDTHKGQKNSALQHAQQLLRQMPWNEEAHREVMELLALNGRRSEALMQFERCKKALHDELGLEPSAETKALYERIKRTTHFSKDNIPAVVTPLIGREGELNALTGLLADPGVRLVTITGLGGMGKTRLALDIAWRHTGGQYQDGVTFVQLAGLESAEFLVQAIAQALHLPLSAGDKNSATSQLLDYLKPKTALLVLDNCEHLLDGMVIANDILEAAPQVQILATSRERLRLRAEYQFPLQGLTHDDHMNHPAADMFQSTAQRINPGFEVTESNTTYINRLCYLVDGLPLALELAASSLDGDTLMTLVGEIERNLDVLSSDFRDIPPRHRSLRVVLESTWSRLTEQTRQVFAALAVFRGSFSADAAREVTGAAPDLLRQLVGQSLLQFEQEGDRYQLHEMLRQFTAEKLAETPEFEQSITRRHFVYYNDLARRGGAAMRGGDQVQWTARLEEEEENIRKVIDWAADNDLESAANLCLALHTFWTTSGRIQEASKEYKRLLQHEELLPPEIRPWLMASYAEILHALGYAEESTALQSAALPLFLELGDNSGAAFVYLLRSLRARDHEFIEVSIEHAETGLKYAQLPGTDSYYRTLLLEALSDALTRSGRFDEAEVLIEQGYRLCLERKDLMGANGFLAHRIFLADSLGQETQARKLNEEYLAESRRLGMLFEELIALDNLGMLLLDEGDLVQAQAYTDDAIVLAREANHRPLLASLDLSMGDILMAKEDYPQALPFLREAIYLVQEIGNETRIALTLEALSRWAWYSDKQDLNAVRCNACAKARLEASGQLRLPSELAIYARTTKDMEARLGKELLARLVLEGKSMPFEEALEELLRTLPQTTKSQ
ncbi:MAG: ATP-binding protein [Candidatus Promineifilaceae bacterium]